MINFSRQTLKNGLKTIHIPLENSNSVTILVLVGTGSRYETKNINGISHFLEHLFFKGTKNRPSTSAIAHELDSIGAYYNAFTSEEYTGFFVTCAKNKIDLASDILSDILINSQFDENEITKEKGVIAEEINMYEDIPQKQIIDLTKEHFYGDTPLGRSTLGTKKIISSLNRTHFLKYLKTHYSAKNSIVAIAGGVDSKTWKKIINNNFGAFNDHKISPPAKCQINKNSSVRLKIKKTDQTHLTLGFNTFARNNENRFTLKLINNILGETMSSRLFTEVREKRGLAYYVGSDEWYFTDTGALVAYAGVDNKRFIEAVEIITEEIKKLSRATITQKELQKAQDNIEGKIYLGLETTFSIAEFYGEQELLYEDILKPSEIVQKMKKISLQEVNSLAHKLIKQNPLKLTSIGPYQNENKLNKLIK